MTIEELFQHYVDMEPEKLVEYAVRSSEPVLEYLSKGLGDDEKAAKLYIAMISTFIGADGSVDKAEYAFSKAVFGFSGTYDEFFDMIKAVYSPDMADKIDELIDGAPKEVKASFVMLGLAFCACNGTMTPHEQKLLIKYME